MPTAATTYDLLRSLDVRAVFCNAGSTELSG